MTVTETVDFAVVIPTLGRPSLARLVEALASSTGPRPREVVLVDDRPGSPAPLPLPEYLAGDIPVRIVATGGRRGPALARNAGWRATPATTEWIAFLDDDVVVGPAWYSALTHDLLGVPPMVAGSQGRIRVPIPSARRPTDWERNVAGLERACWATADMAYRRSVLDEVGGFDERFPRAYREDADLALRVVRAGWLVVRGDRQVTHPIGTASRWVSVRLQAGNADDARMRALHGPDWRTAAQAGAGRTGRHAAATGLLAATAWAAATGKRRPAGIAALGWAAATAGFAWGRIEPGPRTGSEVATMLLTSALIPPLALFHRARGRIEMTQWKKPGAARSPGGGQLALSFPTVGRRIRFGPVPRLCASDPHWTPKAVLFDRDGTLIVDRHYLADPDGVLPMPGARMAVARVKQAGLATAVVTNQSGVGRGLMTRAQMQAVNQRVDRATGPFDYWAVCCHRPEDGCACRKPATGLILEASDQLGVDPTDCAVIGDIGADMDAARRAGARAILVPTRRTRPAEIRRAGQVAPDILTAIDLILAGRC